MRHVFSENPEGAKREFVRVSPELFLQEPIILI
jgi:hypothetical protein